MAERTLLQRLEQAGPTTWLLAAIAGWALLLWVAALLGMGGQVAEAKPAASDALPQAKPAAPDRIGALAQYAESAARPLFTQDRRPRSFLATAPDGGDGAAQSQSLDFILTGVLISPQVQLAVLQPSGGGEAQRVRVGRSPEGVAGWRLIEVQPRRAIFEGAGGQSVLELRTFGEAGAPPAATAHAPHPSAPDAAQAARSAAAAAAAARAAAEPQTQEARIEAIRKRIEARRAQLRAGQTGSGASPSNAPPSGEPPSNRPPVPRRSSDTQPPKP